MGHVNIPTEMEDINNKTQPGYEMRLLAFIDILGWADLLKKSETNNELLHSFPLLVYFSKN
jgi:hypothetical protein